VSDPNYKAKQEASRERLKEHKVIRPSFQNDEQAEKWLKRWAKKNGVTLKKRKTNEKDNAKGII